MSKLLGGLLIAIMLTSPIVKVDYIAYEVLRSQKSIISIMKRQAGDDSHYEADDIDMLLGAVQGNSHVINNLLARKNNAVNEIKAVMDQKARTRQPFSPIQMDTFQTFSAFLGEQNKLIKASLTNVKFDDGRFNMENELLRENTDLASIGKQLTYVLQNQTDAIYHLHNTIFECDKARSLFV